MENNLKKVIQYIVEDNIQDEQYIHYAMYLLKQIDTKYEEYTFLWVKSVSLNKNILYSPSLQADINEEYNEENELTDEEIIKLNRLKELLQSKPKNSKYTNLEWAEVLAILHYGIYLNKSEENIFAELKITNSHLKESKTNSKALKIIAKFK